MEIPLTSLYPLAGGIGTNLRLAERQRHVRELQRSSEGWFVGVGCSVNGNI